MNNITVYSHNYWTQSRSLISTRRGVPQDWEPVLVLSVDIAASCGRSDYWLSPQLLIKTAHGCVADLWFCRRQILIIWYRHTLTTGFITTGCLHVVQLTRSISMCGVHVWACHMLYETPASRYPVTAAVWLPWRPTAVSRCCVPQRLVSLRTLSHWEFWEVHYPRGSLPVRFPVCLALHRPPDGKCLLLITHRWTERTEMCVHICVCLPVTLFIFVTVFIKIPKLWQIIVFLSLKHLLNWMM